MQEEKVATYAHWVNQSLFRPPRNRSETRRKLGFSKKEFVVLFVGRLLARKGASVMLKVAKNSPADIRFLFVGAGPMEGEISRAAERLPNVEMIGKIDAANLANYYGAADLVVAAPQYDEGFTRVALEAISCGTPILAANTGSLTDIADESVSIFTHPDVEHLCSKIAHLQEKRDELERLAARCRDYAEQNYSERNAELIIRAYRGEAFLI